MNMSNSSGKSKEHHLRKLNLVLNLKACKELGIEYYKTNGNNKYKVSTEFLHELATTRHWVHEIDNYSEEQPTKEEQGSTKDGKLIQN